MIKLLLVACAGGLGTLARYGLAGLVQRFTGSMFPWGTLTVNIIGCLLFGVVWSLAESRLQGASEYRLLILTGFMGAFTTFSTFIFETGQLIRDNEWLLALGNIGIQNTVGVLVLFLGLILGRLISLKEHILTELQSANCLRLFIMKMIILRSNRFMK